MNRDKLVCQDGEVRNRHLKRCREYFPWNTDNILTEMAVCGMTLYTALCHLAIIDLYHCHSMVPLLCWLAPCNGQATAECCYPVYKLALHKNSLRTVVCAV